MGEVMTEIVDAVTLDLGVHGGSVVVAPENVAATVERFARVAPVLGADAMRRAMELRDSLAPPQPAIETALPVIAEQAVASICPQPVYI